MVHPGLYSGLADTVEEIPSSWEEAFQRMYPVTDATELQAWREAG